MIRSLIIAALLGGLISAQSLGQSCLAIDQAVRLAASQDPRVDAARARVELAETQFSDALALRRPSFSAFTRTSSGDTGLTANQIENQVGLQVSQRILDFGDARLARSSARNGVRAQEYALQGEQIASAGRAARAVLSFARAGENQTLVEQRIAYFQDLSTRMETLLEAGGATRDSVAGVQARLAAALAEASEFELERTRAAVDLAILTGVETEPCDAVSESDVIDLARNESAPAGDNPQIRGLQREIAAAEADLRRQRRARLPTIDVVAIGSYAYDDIRDEWALRDRVGVDISVPLYEGDRLRARSQRASAQLSLAESELASAQRSLNAELRASAGQVRALQTLRDRRSAAAERKAEELAAVETAFRGGQRTLFELLETRVGLSQARSDLIAVRYALFAEYLRLAELSGALDIPLDPVEGPQARKIWGWEPDPSD